MRMGRANSTLICRNVTMNGRRTSLRLEREMWAALQEIAEREGTSLSDLCGELDRDRRESSLTAGVRVFIVSYFRAAATEDGHRLAGHGQAAGKGAKDDHRAGQGRTGGGRNTRLIA